jgi:hypothetical protein
MDRRREPRHDLEFSVRIWGVDRNARAFTEVVRATSISPVGAVLLDTTTKFHAGDMVDVQHEARNAQYRVIWTREGETGLQALPSQQMIFGEDVPKTFAMAGKG